MISPEPGPDDVLTLAEVAAITGLAVQTHRNLRVRGEGPRMWLLRGRVRCYRRDLDVWMAAQSGADKVIPLRRTA